MMQSFADAVYRVHGDGEVTPLRIGQASPAMAALMARHGARHGGLVTGENPFGQLLLLEERLRAARPGVGIVMTTARTRYSSSISALTGTALMPRK